MLIPVPLSNIPPAILVALIAFAYLEEDGVLLSASLAATVLLIGTFAAIVWETLNIARWVEELF